MGGLSGLIDESGLEMAPYFRGMNSKLTMTILNASLMFMSKEWILLMVLRVKGLMGRRAI